MPMEIVAVLHDIRSIHNVGSIFRTADAAGIKKIFLCGITPAPVDRFKHIRADFAKVSLGAERTVVWEAAKETADVLKKLSEAGYEIVAVEQAKKSTPYYAKAAARKIALVLGNEVEGLLASILKMADTVIEIPMSGAKESLNVAVAFGIVAFRLRYPSARLVRI